MSTLDATVSMLEAMPEDARIKVMEFTQKLFTSRKPANPFVPVSQEQILSDLAESRQQIADGKGLDMEDAIELCSSGLHSGPLSQHQAPGIFRNPFPSMGHE